MADKEKSGYESLKEYMDARFDTIEAYSRMMLMTNIMNQMDDAEEAMEEEQMMDLIEGCHMEYVRKEKFGERTLYYVAFPEKAGIKRIREVFAQITENSHSIPVFVMDKLTKSQKRKMMEEQYSYFIPEKELYISI